jgi:DNA-binding NarL/FixJ family response regulator
MKSLRILLVDDHDVVRMGLNALLSRQDGFEIVAEASNAEQAKRYALHYNPDVIVMDVRLPGKSGIQATQEIKKLMPAIKIIILTSYGDEDLLFDAIRAGANGYVLKQIGSDDLIRALNTIEQGNSLLDPKLTQTLFKRVREVQHQSEWNIFSNLTEHELQILGLLTTGKSNKQIADCLNLAHGTVRNYVSSLMHKIGVGNRAEAVVLAIEHHIEEHLPVNWITSF